MIEKHAILIGINGYAPDSGLAPLRFAEEDARKLGQTLKDDFGFQTTVLLGAQATRDAIERELLSERKGDLLLWFFAGHGQMLENYRLHPVDSTAAGLKTIPFDDFRRRWQGPNFGFSKVFAILDACRSEAAGMRGGQRGFSAPEARDILAVTQGRRQVEVLYGCQEGQVSYEDERLRHGLLTHALLGVLEDTRQRGYLDTDLLAGDATDRMEAWSTQDPRHRWQLAHRYHIPTLKRKLVIFGDPDRAAWDKARQKLTAEALLLYLEQFPEGAHAAEAQATLRGLREAADWERAREANTPVACAQFLKDWPAGRFAAEARKLSGRLQAEEQAWQAARRADTPEDYQAFAAEYPASRHAAAATRRLQEMADDDRAWAAAQTAGTLAAVEAYLAATTEERHRQAATTLKRALQDDADWASASQSRDLGQVRGYQVTYGAAARHFQEAGAFRQALEAEAQAQLDAARQADEARRAAARQQEDVARRRQQARQRRRFAGVVVLLLATLSIFAYYQSHLAEVQRQEQLALQVERQRQADAALAAKNAELEAERQQRAAVEEQKNAEIEAERKQRAAVEEKKNVELEAERKQRAAAEEKLKEGQTNLLALNARITALTNASSQSDRDRQALQAALEEKKALEAQVKTLTAAAEQAMPSATKEHPRTNSLGMPFVPVPGTEVLFCTWLVRVKDFAVFAGDRAGNGGWDYRKGSEPFVLKNDGWKQRGWEYGWQNPGFAQTTDHPVPCVSYEDAQAFCAWLTKKERAEGKLTASQSYRLPLDWEWSVAVGLAEAKAGAPKEKTKKMPGYPWGTTNWPPPVGAGNYAGSEAKDADWPSTWGIIDGYRDGYTRTSPVERFAANRYGLYDMGGNVYQWCEDWHDGEQTSRVLRGGSWTLNVPDYLLSSFRNRSAPVVRIDYVGFRVVLVVGSVR